MALISCPECGREVSDRAETCPQCGHPLKEKWEPGWYNDPSGKPLQAYWDGTKWTGETRSAGAPSTVPATTGRKGIPAWVWVVGGIVLVGIYIGSQLESEPDGVAETFNAISDALDGESATPSNVNDRVSLSAGGDGETRQFTLGGGSYTVRTEVGNDCYYSFTLRDPSDGSRVKSVTSMSDVGTSTVSVHGVDRGTYYVDVITGPAPDCPWEQTWTSS